MSGRLINADEKLIRGSKAARLSIVSDAVMADPRKPAEPR